MLNSETALKGHITQLDVFKTTSWQTTPHARLFNAIHSAKSRYSNRDLQTDLKIGGLNRFANRADFKSSRSKSKI
jgi:hypothetical protein